MAITASMVKELRERTGLGMMDCKKALTETDGDIDAAIDKLRKESGLKAAKKAGRTAAEGLLASSGNGSRAVLAEVNIETDFAARNEKFIAFTKKIADEAFAREAADAAALMDAELDAERETLVQEIGENISVRRVAGLSGEVVAAYVHADNRKGALVALEGGDAELARDIAMHVVATAPLVTEPSDLPEEVVAKEREIFAAQARDSGKPEEIIEKMITGRVNKYLAEVSLVSQPFVKDPDVKVGKLLSGKGAKCLGFVRYEVGEGIEKDETDFAAEVAAQLGQDDDKSED